MAIFQRIALFITILGALNWGCVGLFQFDPIATLFQGVDSIFTRGIFTIVGIAGIITIPLLWAEFQEKRTSKRVNPETSAST